MPLQPQIRALLQFLPVYQPLLALHHPLPILFEVRAPSLQSLSCSTPQHQLSFLTFTPTAFFCVALTTEQSTQPGRGPPDQRPHISRGLEADHRFSVLVLHPGEHTT